MDGLVFAVYIINTSLCPSFPAFLQSFLPPSLPNPFFPSVPPPSPLFRPSYILLLSLPHFLSHPPPPSVPLSPFLPHLAYPSSSQLLHLKRNNVMVTVAVKMREEALSVRLLVTSSVFLSLHTYFIPSVCLFFSSFSEFKPKLRPVSVRRVSRYM